jgi:hypothetical protein
MTSKRRKAFYGFLVLAAVGAAIGTPSIIEGYKQKKDADSASPFHSLTLCEGS